MIYYKSFLLFCAIIFASFNGNDCFLNRILKNARCFIQRKFYHIPCNYQGIIRGINGNDDYNYISPWKFAVSRNFDHKFYSDGSVDSNKNYGRNFNPDRTDEINNNNGWNFYSEGNVKTETNEGLNFISDRNIKTDGDSELYYDSLRNTKSSGEYGYINGYQENNGDYSENNGVKGLKDYSQRNVESNNNFHQDFYSDTVIENNGVKGLNDYSQKNVEKPAYSEYYYNSKENTDGRISSGFFGMNVPYERQ